MADATGKNVFDLADKWMESQSPEAIEARTFRAGMLSPVIGGSLTTAINSFERSADSTEISKARPEAPMLPKHAEFIMRVRETQVEDVLILHGKFHGRTS